MSLRFMAIAAALLASNSVLAAEVVETTDIAASVDQVWKQVEPFCSLSEWHPAVEKCDLRRLDGKLERVITLKNGAVIEERLLDSSAAKHKITYSILAAPLPVKDYSASLILTPSGKDTKIVWEAKFTSDGVTDEEAKKIVSGIFTAGFDGLKQKIGAQ